MRSTEATALLITDGDCEFCQLSAAWLSRNFPGNWSNQPSKNLDINSLGLSQEDVAKQVWYLVPANNSWLHYGGAEAVLRLLLQQPKLLIKPFAYLFTLPGFNFIAQTIYIWVTKNRHRLMWIFKR